MKHYLRVLAACLGLITSVSVLAETHSELPLDTVSEGVVKEELVNAVAKMLEGAVEKELVDTIEEVQVDKAESPVIESADESGMDAALDTGIDDWVYRVKQGDTIWWLCKTYVSDPLCWQKLVEYNELTTPEFMSIGTAINFPRAWLKVLPLQATVIALGGEVWLQEADQLSLQPLQLNQKLNQGDQIETHMGSATLVFVDGSRLLMSSNTKIELQRLFDVQYANRVESQIMLSQGRVRVSTEKMKTQVSRFDVNTQAATASVRSADMRVAVMGDNHEVMIIEVVAGSAYVANTMNRQKLPPGYAAKVIAGQEVQQPVAFLPRVQFLESKQMKHTAPLSSAYSWLPVEGALSYNVEFFKGEVGQQLMFNYLVDTPRLSLDGLTEGRYQLNIRAVDAAGFEGFDRQVKLNVKKKSPVHPAGSFE